MGKDQASGWAWADRLAWGLPAPEWEPLTAQSKPQLRPKHMALFPELHSQLSHPLGEPHTGLLELPGVKTPPRMPRVT